MPEPPVRLSKWNDYAKWLPKRVKSFPKNTVASDVRSRLQKGGLNAIVV